MWLISIFAWLFIFYLIEGKSNVPRHLLGGGKTTIQAPPAPAAPPPVPNAGETARDVFEAQLEFLPKASQLSFDLASDPTTGTRARTQLQEDVRRDVFAGESGVRDQLIANVLGQLLSPTGLTQQQTAAQEAIRGRESERLTTGIRERANLGGGLFSGNAQQQERLGQQELGQAFATQDIARQDTARLNAIQAALPLLSILFPEASIQGPSFLNPVPSAGQQLGANVTGRGQDIGFATNIFGQQNQAAIANAQNQAALQSALFGGLGSAAGGLFTGAGTAGGFGKLF